jgi:hypothetical protein
MGAKQAHSSGSVAKGAALTALNVADAAAAAVDLVARAHNGVAGRGQVVVGHPLTASVKAGGVYGARNGGAHALVRCAGRDCSR